MLNPKAIVFILLAVILGLVYSNLRVLCINLLYSHDILDYKKKIVSASRLNEKLESALAGDLSEEEIELKARTLFGFVKEGEVAYQLVSKKGDRDYRGASPARSWEHR